MHSSNSVQTSRSPGLSLSPGCSSPVSPTSTLSSLPVFRPRSCHTPASPLSSPSCPVSAAEFQSLTRSPDRSSSLRSGRTRSRPGSAALRTVRSLIPSPMSLVSPQTAMAPLFDRSHLPAAHILFPADILAADSDLAVETSCTLPHRSLQISDRSPASQTLLLLCSISRRYSPSPRLYLTTLQTDSCLPLPPPSIG